MDNISTKRWIYMDVCKILAMLFIVVMHVSSGAWGMSAPGSYEWQVLGTFNSLSRLGIPLFLMQMGAVMLNEKKELSIRDIYGKYVSRIVTAFFFWSTLNMVLYYLLDAPGRFGDFVLWDFITGILKGDQYKHWFIFIVISMYLVIPIMREIAKSLTICRYFLILWVIYSFIIPTIYQTPYIFNAMPEMVQKVLYETADTVNRVRPMMVLDYIGYFVLGHYIHTYAFTRKQTNWYAVLGMLGFAYTMLMTIYVSLRDGGSTEAIYANVSFNVCLMAAAVMIGAKALLEKTWFSDRVYKSLLFFADVSFGIFLVHDFIRMALVRVGIDTLSFNPIVSVPVLSVVVFVISGGIAYGIGKIPKIGKYIV